MYSTGILQEATVRHLARVELFLLVVLVVVELMLMLLLLLLLLLLLQCS